MIADTGINELNTTSRNFAWAVSIPSFAVALLAILLQQVPGSNTLSEDVSIVMGLLLAFSLTTITSFRWLQTGRMPAGWFALMLGSYLWVVAESIDLDDLKNIGIAWDDVVPLVIWVLTVAIVLPILLRDGLKSYTKAMLGLGLVLQTISFVANLGDGSAFNMPHSTVTEMLKVNESFEALSLAAYISSLLVILKVIVFETKDSPSGVLWNLINTTPGRAVGIIGEDVSWLMWRMANPRAPFSKFYADSIERKLDRGRPHKTLGQHTFSRSSVIFSQGDRAQQFASEGHDKHDYLARYVASPDTTIVDYGCGSLRIGQHFIRSQKPRRFWGLDVTDRFYNDGLALIGEALAGVKQPQLRKIDEKSLREVRAARPDLVYSVAVMKHVPRAELETYWDNILGLLLPGSTAVVFADISEVEMRTAAKNWAYTQDDVMKIIKRLAPSVKVEVEIFGTPLYFGGKRFDPARFVIRA